MSSLIPNKVKTNLCLVPLKLFIVRTILYATVSNLYNNNYNNICLFDIFLTQLFAILLTLEILKPLFWFTRNFTPGWLISDYLSSALSCVFILQHDQSNERFWNRSFAFSKTLSRLLVYVHSHTCLSLFLSCLLLLVYLDRIPCICLCVFCSPCLLCVRLCLSYADVVGGLLVTSPL